MHFVPGQESISRSAGCFPISAEAVEALEEFLHFGGESPRAQYDAIIDEINQNNASLAHAIWALAGRCGLEREVELGISPGMAMPYKLISIQAGISGVPMPRIRRRSVHEVVSAYCGDTGITRDNRSYIYKRLEELRGENKNKDNKFVSTVDNFMAGLMMAGSSDRANMYVFGSVSTYDLLKREDRPSSSLSRLPIDA